MAVQISGNDITVPRDGTFTRNVTIGGTLTYEDVTNIDSVGLVTARTGIEIGARPGVAASISVDGNAIFSGVTTVGGRIDTTDATDGALNATFTRALDNAFQLQFRNHGSTNDNRAGVGSFGVFRGDNDIVGLRFMRGTGAAGAGSLAVTQAGVEKVRVDYTGRVGIGTSIPEHALDIQGSSGSFTKLALSNQTMNTSKYEIIFGDQGQVNHVVAANREITFATNGSERLRIDSAGRVLIGGTSAIIGSSTEFNEIVLTGKTRGSGITLQDADANVRFQIRTDDDASGSLGTLLNASTNHNISIRTNNTEKVLIRANGLLTVNKQYFLIVDLSNDIGSYNATGSGGVVIFNRIAEEYKDSSLSSCFNTSTGLFTAPITGLYFLEAAVYSTNASFGQSWFVVAGARKSFTDEVMTGGAGFTHNHTMLRLTSGETVGYLPYMSSGTNVNIKANANHTYMKISLMC